MIVSNERKAPADRKMCHKKCDPVPNVLHDKASSDLNVNAVSAESKAAPPSIAASRDTAALRTINHSASPTIAIALAAMRPGIGSPKSTNRSAIRAARNAPNATATWGHGATRRAQMIAIIRTKIAAGRKSSVNDHRVRSPCHRMLPTPFVISSAHNT